MLRKTVVFISFILLAHVGMGQKDFTKEADKAFDGQGYHAAIELYKRAYPKEKSMAKKAEILFKIADCYRLTLDLLQAETWYKKAIKANYDDPMAILYLADALKAQEKYDEALTQYQEYSAKKADDERGTRGVKSCKMAQEWKDEPAKFEIQNEVLLNSKMYDFSPIFADKKYETLIFSSMREGATGDESHAMTGQNSSDLFYSKRDNKGKWSVPINLSEKINTEAEEGASCMDSKQSELYFTRCTSGKNGEFGCKIYKSKKMGQQFGDPEEVVLGPDSFSYRHPALTPDDQYLVFSSNMPGGQGSSDLWYCQYDKSKRSWGAPVNLGPAVNTKWKEGFPYVHADGSLYFASDGHLGMGGLDIFIAEKVGEAKWAGVSNLRNPINSAGDDLGIVFEEKVRGYFTSNREGGKGSDDIYSFYVPSLVFVMQGNITNVSSGQPIAGAKITLTDNEGNSYESVSDEQGYYEFGAIPNSSARYVVENRSYKIFVSKEEHLNAKGEETTVGVENSTTFVHDFALQKFFDPDGGNPVEIKFPEVLYEFGKWALKPESKDSLDFLYQVLIDNPTIVIELSAHTDSRGSDVFNEALAQKRAKSCVDYLIERGINPERMKPVGYGETRLLITDKEIARMSTEEEQEQAHQKNRRTVFSVIRADFVPEAN